MKTLEIENDNLMENNECIGIIENVYSDLSIDGYIVKEVDGEGVVGDPFSIDGEVIKEHLVDYPELSNIAKEDKVIFRLTNDEWQLSFHRKYDA